MCALTSVCALPNCDRWCDVPEECATYVWSSLQIVCQRNCSMAFAQRLTFANIFWLQSGLHNHSRPWMPIQARRLLCEKSNSRQEQSVLRDSDGEKRVQRTIGTRWFVRSFPKKLHTFLRQGPFSEFSVQSIESFCIRHLRVSINCDSN